MYAQQPPGAQQYAQQYAGGAQHQLPAAASSAPLWVSDGGAPPPYYGAPSVQQRQGPGSHGHGLEAGSRPPDIAGVLSPLGALGLGTSAERVIDASGTFVAQHYQKYLAGHSVRYYFTVSQPLVFRKLLMLAVPPLVKGPWHRSRDTSVGGAGPAPPAADVHAPDLYVPLMALVTYTALASAGRCTAGRFTPEDAAASMWRGVLGWTALACVMLGGVRSLSVGQGSVASGDVVACAGYALVGVDVAAAAGLASPRLRTLATVWVSIAYFLFAVKCLRRDLVQSGARGGGPRQRVTLLLVVAAHVPITQWLLGSATARARA